jgi:hypothetical protein
MRSSLRVVVFALFALLISAAAQAGISKLKPSKGFKPVNLRDYTVVVIEDFGDGVEKPMKTPEDTAARREAVLEAGKKLADALAAKLTESKAFAEIARETRPGKVLVIGGKITDFRAANLAGRYIGLGAGSRFDALVEVRDAESGTVLGAVKVDLGGSAIPGVTNLIQTVDRFIDGTVVRVSDEILIAKGAKFREQTGRAGRLREKYTPDD